MSFAMQMTTYKLLISNQRVDFVKGKGCLFDQRDLLPSSGLMGYCKSKIISEPTILT